VALLVESLVAGYLLARLPVESLAADYLLARLPVESLAADEEYRVVALASAASYHRGLSRGHE
jgi:hypothetical protein